MHNKKGTDCRNA